MKPQVGENKLDMSGLFPLKFLPCWCKLCHSLSGEDKGKGEGRLAAFLSIQIPGMNPFHRLHVSCFPCPIVSSIGICRARGIKAVLLLSLGLQLHSFDKRASALVLTFLIFEGCRLLVIVTCFISKTTLWCFSELQLRSGHFEQILGQLLLYFLRTVETLQQILKVLFNRYIKYIRLRDY